MDLAWNIPKLILIIVPEGKKVVQKTVEKPNSTNEMLFAGVLTPPRMPERMAGSDSFPANLIAKQLYQLQIVRNAKRVCLLV